MSNQSWLSVWWLTLALIFTSRAKKIINKEDLFIGGLFDQENTEGNLFTEQAFKLATEWVNQNNILHHFTLKPKTRSVDPFDSYKLSTQVCELLSEGVAGVFGPYSVDTSDHVQSICDSMEIPHIEMRWDSRQRRGSCLVNLYPHSSTFSQAFVDLITIYEWDGFTLIYEDNDGLIQLSGLLTYYDHKGYPVTVNQLNETGDYRSTMRKVKESEQKNIVLDCSIKNLYKALLHAQQVGLMGSDYSYIITNLDFQTIDYDPFMHAGTTITGIRLFDPDSTQVQDVFNFWSARQDVHGHDVTGNTLLAETAMTHDAVVLYAKAFNELVKSHNIKTNNLSCENFENWDHGYSIINYMKVTEVLGITGLIKFDNEGFRSDFELDLIQLTSDGISKKGTWNTTNGVNFTSSSPGGPDVVEEELDLRNQTFIVMISLVDPHVMLKEDIKGLVGNDKYEGMGVDVIHELSLINGFNYTFREQEEGGSGGYNNKTGRWTGMLGKLFYKEAELAIADITITRDRLAAVDFTPPYMNLGISILYKNPKKVPSLFSFMTPFSNQVWQSVIAAYVGVSLLTYVVARISPKEWTNPNPCIDDDDVKELENQFSLNNSFWFVTGAIMQQGSELAPMSVSTRLLASVWWFFTLIIVASYTANLSAFLTVEQNQELFSNVHELANQPSNAPVPVKYGAKAGGATEGFFKSSNNSLYQKMWTYMRINYDDVMTKSNKEGVDRVLSTTEEYAFLMESASIDYEVQRNCELRQVGDPLDNKGYGIAMPKNATFRNALSSSVIKLQEKGKLTQLYKKWWNEQRGGGACDDSSEGGGDAEELDLNNVGGVFIVMMLGCFFAIFIALGELMYEVFMKEDKESFWGELKKELKFVLSCKGTVKKLKPSSSEENNSIEEEDVIINKAKKGKTPNGLSLS